MNEKTKKLDIALSNVRFEVGGAGLQFLSPIIRKEILNICRDKGLKFVDIDEGFMEEVWQPVTKIEGIEIEENTD